MKYTQYSFLFPPRPSNAISDDVIDAFDDGTFLAQVKTDGSCCLIFSNGKEFRVMNRHNAILTNVQIADELRKLNKSDKWSVLVGEYLNKNKLDENLNPFNHKYIIFDILVYDNDYLLGKTFTQRQELLDSLYELKEYNFYLDQISENIFRVKNFYSNFHELWLKLVKIGVCEGLVFKRKKSPLEVGYALLNNSKSMFKCRKRSKNIKF